MTMEMSMGLAKHYGITISSEDAPKVIAAIQTAYATGKADELEACAQFCESQRSMVLDPLRTYSAHELAQATINTCKHLGKMLRARGRA